jgi:hypothetical protein
VKNVLKGTKPQLIEFTPTGAAPTNNPLELEHLQDPKPAKFHLPEWYKKATLFEGKNKINPEVDTYLPHLGFKTCMSFFDGLTLGYMISTEQDIWLLADPDQPSDGESGKAKVHWNGVTQPVEVRDTSTNATLPIPLGCADSHLAWKVQWGVNLPKGYSALYTHPINRFDLPFITLTGVMDDGFISGGNVPFFMKKNFYGLIPAGTPILQVIPFKRESWTSRVNRELLALSNVQRQRARSVHRGWYKKNIWKKKRFD